MAIETIRTKCPNCGCQRRMEVITTTTEIRHHTCRTGHEYVIKISPSRESTIRGARALITVVSWNPVFTPRTQEAGHLHTARNGCRVYLAESQGMDVAGMKYAVVCTHGNLIGATSLRDAKVVAANPVNFCNENH